MAPAWGPPTARGQQSQSGQPIQTTLVHKLSGRARALLLICGPDSPAGLPRAGQLPPHRSAARTQQWAPQLGNHFGPSWEHYKWLKRGFSPGAEILISVILFFIYFKNIFKLFLLTRYNNIIIIIKRSIFLDFGNVGDATEPQRGWYPKRR